MTADDLKNLVVQFKDKVKEVQALSPTQVRFVLKEPWPDFMTFYGTPATGAAWIVPKKYVEKVGDEYRRKIKTAALNKVLEEAQKAHQPPVYHGKRLRFFYMTQTGTRPPSFIVFVNKAEGVHFSYRRYLTNCLRQAFGFAGCPIRLHFEDRER